MENVAIVVVTFKRQELLRKLFDSYLQSTVAPWRIVVVDNENSQATADVVHVFEREANALWGFTAADGRGGKSRVVYCPQPENLGGSGGFSAGVKAAYELGAQWFWLMDDDVAIEPEGLARLSKWTERYKVVQGSRYDYDDGPFYWQYHFSVALGIYDPFAPAAFSRVKLLKKLVFQTIASFCTGTMRCMATALRRCVSRLLFPISSCDARVK